MSQILVHTLYQLKIRITKELRQRDQEIEMDFEILASEHDDIQKYHMELKQKNEEIQKVQETLNTTMQRVYQKVMREGIDIPVEDKVHKVDDTISHLKPQIQELQLKMKPKTPPQERHKI